jgi:hypothetical protein
MGVYRLGMHSMDLHDVGVNVMVMGAYSMGMLSVCERSLAVLRMVMHSVGMHRTAA